MTSLDHSQSRVLFFQLCHANLSIHVTQTCKCVPHSTCSSLIVVLSWSSFNSIISMASEGSRGSILRESEKASSSVMLCRFLSECSLHLTHICEFLSILSLLKYSHSHSHARTHTPIPTWRDAIFCWISGMGGKGYSDPVCTLLMFANTFDIIYDRLWPRKTEEK